MEAGEGGGGEAGGEVDGGGGGVCFSWFHFLLPWIGSSGGGVEGQACACSKITTLQNHYPLHQGR